MTMIDVHEFSLEKNTDPQRLENFLKNLDLSETNKKTSIKHWSFFDKEDSVLYGCLRFDNGAKKGFLRSNTEKLKIGKVENEFISFFIIRKLKKGSFGWKGYYFRYPSCITLKNFSEMISEKARKNGIIEKKEKLISITCPGWTLDEYIKTQFSKIKVLTLRNSDLYSVADAPPGCIYKETVLKVVEQPTTTGDWVSKLISFAKKNNGRLKGTLLNNKERTIAINDETIFPTANQLEYNDFVDEVSIHSEKENFHENKYLQSYAKE